MSEADQTSSGASSNAAAEPPLDLLFVLPALGAGGAERVVTTLANHWSNEGQKIGIVTFETDSTPPYYPLAPAVRLKHLNLPAVSRPLWRAVRHTSKRISVLGASFDELKPRVIVSFLTKANVMSLLAARGRKVPVIVSERNNPELQRFGWIWETARSLTYPSAYSLVTITQRAADWYPERLKPRLHVIPNPAELPAEWRNLRAGNQLTAVGRLVRQKRFDLLLDAFALVAPKHPNWNLVIWGEGPLRAELEAQRDRLGLQGRADFKGVTPQPGSWIEMADIFVLSSEFEGFGNVLNEAMTAGLPVISFDCRYGPAELISHRKDGLLVPPLDAPALAAAINELIDDKGLRDRLAAAAKVSSERFTLARVEKDWRKLIAEARDFSASSA